MSDEAKRKYRLTLPMDFGDGVVHQHGEIVELAPDKAKLYAHGLIACKDEDEKE